MRVCALVYGVTFSVYWSSTLEEFTQGDRAVARKERYGGGPEAKSRLVGFLFSGSICSCLPYESRYMPKCTGERVYHTDQEIRAAIESRGVEVAEEVRGEF